MSEFFSLARIRPIFLFHIPKTGGTSVFDTFRDGIGARNSLHIEDLRPDSLQARVQSAMQAGTTRIFRAHVSPLALPAWPEMIGATVLREPVERIISKFHHVYRNRHDLQKHYEFLRSCRGYRDGRFTREDLQRWIVEREQDNDQVRYLSGQYHGVLNAQALVDAQRALASCSLVGVTEQLGPFIALLAQRSGNSVSRQIRANESPLHLLEEDAGAMRDFLRPHLELDYEVHAQAQEIAQGLLAGMPPSPLATAPAVRRRHATLPERLAGLLRSNSRELSGRVRSRLRRARNRLRDLF